MSRYHYWWLGWPLCIQNSVSLSFRVFWNWLNDAFIQAPTYVFFLSKHMHEIYEPYRYTVICWIPICHSYIPFRHASIKWHKKKTNCVVLKLLDFKSLRDNGRSDLHFVHVISLKRVYYIYEKYAYYHRFRSVDRNIFFYDVFYVFCPHRFAKFEIFIEDGWVT